MTVKLVAGMKINKLTLLREVRRPGVRGWFWGCKCDCGNEATIYSGRLRSGGAVACGCMRRPPSRTVHGMTRTAEFKAWQNAKSRCYNEKNDVFYLYGGRGISMCERWQKSFENFFADMGPRPSHAHSLDRIDSNGNYEPNNCRWATDDVQNNNRSCNRFVTIGERRLTIAQASRLSGLSETTIRRRLNAGCTDQEVVRNAAKTS